MWSCAVCNKEMIKVNQITNTHVKGDKKYIYLLQCPQCGKAALRIYMDVNVTGRDETLEYRIDITEDEKKRIKFLMEKCPDAHNEKCRCNAHNEVDRFEMENSDRRKLVGYSYDLWN